MSWTLDEFNTKRVIQLVSAVWQCFYFPQELLTTLYLGFCILVSASYILFLAEREQHETQYDSFAKALWWGIVSGHCVVFVAIIKSLRVSHFEVLVDYSQSCSSVLITEYHFLVKLHWWLWRLWCSGTLWLVKNFVLSRYNHREVIIVMTAFSFQNGDQICWCFGVANFCLCYFLE